MPLSLQLGIYSLTEEDVGSHQSHSRKTLIALVTAGLLLAVLGLAGYFLMNRRSWSPAGERLVSWVPWGGRGVQNQGATPRFAAPTPRLLPQHATLLSPPLLCDPHIPPAPRPPQPALQPPHPHLAAPSKNPGSSRQGH